jgi:hypothetical protein
MNATETPVGPLDTYIRERQVSPDIDDMLACEREGHCPDPRPVLDLSFLGLRMRLPGWIPRYAPRFGLFDPKARFAVCRYNPGTGNLIQGEPFDGEGFRTGIPRSRARGLMLLGGFMGSIGLSVTMGALCPSHWWSFALIGVGLAGFVASILLHIHGFGDEPRYSARYSGPIPTEIRERIRQNKNKSLIVAPVDRWTKEKLPPRPVYDPYLVTLCEQGGRTHLHVEAWWDLSKGEQVLREFVMPGVEKTSVLS